jgi:membrane protein required for colicin V production
VSGQVRGNGLGALDRSLGLVFGLARGAVIVCAAFILGDFFERDHSRWPETAKTARLMPTVERGAAFLEKLLPDDLLKTGEAAINRSLEAVEQGQAIGNTIQSITPETGAPADATNGANATGAGANSTNGGAGAQEPGGQDAGSGYKDAERNDLNRLIQGSE